MANPLHMRSLHPEHKKALNRLLNSLDCEIWEVEADTLDEIVIDGVFTVETLQALTTFFTTLSAECSSATSYY
jgi:hypothetical protein